MGRYEPIAYTEDGAVLCPGCIDDPDGDDVGVIAPWDEWWDYTEDQCETLICDECFAALDEAHGDTCQDLALGECWEIARARLADRARQARHAYWMRRANQTVLFDDPNLTNPDHLAAIKEATA